MAPVMCKNLLKSWAVPIDANKTWNGKPIFGKHKTWRGLLLGSLFGVIIFFIQQKLYIFPFFQSYSLVNYSETSIFLGFLLGFGAVFGDLIKSFLKRRVNIASGKSWIPFDQIDYTIGAIACAAPIYFVGWLESIYGVLIYFILHVIINHIAYYTKIRGEKW